MADVVRADSGQEAQTTPVAIIYDRIATSDPAFLADRLSSCRKHACGKGWRVVGEYVDEGADALDDENRPALDDALAMVRRVVGRDRAVVILVKTDTRLSHSDVVRLKWMRRIQLAGGRLACVDERTREPMPLRAL